MQLRLTVHVVLVAALLGAAATMPNTVRKGKRAIHKPEPNIVEIDGKGTQKISGTQSLASYLEQEAHSNDKKAHKSVAYGEVNADAGTKSLAFTEVSADAGTNRKSAIEEEEDDAVLDEQEEAMTISHALMRKQYVREVRETPANFNGPFPHTEIDCKWASWVTHGVCTKSCGTGKVQQKRTRAQAAAYGGEECKGESTRYIKCGTEDCPTTTIKTMQR